MNFHDVLRKLITGLTIPQQYVCIALEELSNPLLVTLTTSSNTFSLDVTHRHLFLGYKPLIIALLFSKHEQVAEFDNCCLNFHFSQLSIKNHQWRKFYTDKDSLAWLALKKIYSYSADDEQVLFYEGTYGEHRFLPLWQQIINRQREKMQRKNSDNVSLAGNLHDQVRIAYSIPRPISLITVCSGNNMNMFPTDLHGSASRQLYISSLRKGGKANAQVECCRKLALSSIDAQEFKLAYTLGKNHMQDLKPMESFKCFSEVSRVFSLPLPESVISYRELMVRKSFDIGIHRIHLYETLHEEKAKDRTTLAHIHQYYAQWRINHGLITKMLLR